MDKRADLPFLRTTVIRELGDDRPPGTARILRHISAGCPGFSRADLDRLWTLGITAFIEEYTRMLDGEGRSR